MPTYDYRLEADGSVHEGNHAMSSTVDTWAELCAAAGLDLRDIPAETRVHKVFSAASVVRSESLKNPDAPACARPNCCGGVCDN